MTEEHGTRIIVKYHERDNYTIIPNSILEDNTLSYKAKGILCRVLSKPGTWRMRLGEFSSAGKDGEVAVRSGIQELLDAGYAEEVWLPRKDGTPEKTWRFSSRTEFAKTGFCQNGVLPEWGNPTLVSTETTSKYTTAEQSSHHPVNVVHPHNSNSNTTTATTTTKTTTSPASPPASQGITDGPIKDEVVTVKAMVMAYLDGLRKSGRAVSDKTFPRHVRSAKAGIELGFVPEQVESATMVLSKEQFWSDKIVPIEKVIERLQSKPVTMRKAEQVNSTFAAFIDPFKF